MTANLGKLTEFGEEFNELIKKGVEIFNPDSENELRENNLFKNLNNQQYQVVLSAVRLISDEGIGKFGSKEYESYKKFYIHYSSTKE